MRIPATLTINLRCILGMFPEFKVTMQFLQPFLEDSWIREHFYVSDASGQTVE